MNAPERHQFAFRKAVREQTSLLIALAGPSGSGKTFSALRLAKGLAGDKGRIAFIDTEAGRGLHYADQFEFDHGDFKPPFSPQAYVEAILAAEEAGYDVVVIDSMSHEYDGEGGICDWADELEAKGTKSPGNWKVPKRAHKKMTNRLLQLRCHLIFCLRAEEKIKIERVDNRTVVSQAGWQPICEKRFMYEMTCSFMLLDSAPGVGQPIKLQAQHAVAFPKGAVISEESGRMLADWAHSEGDAPNHASEVMRIAQESAEGGTEAFRAWYKDLTKPDRAVVFPHLHEFQKTATEADQASTLDLDNDDPFADSGGEPESPSAAEEPQETSQAETAPAAEPPSGDSEEPVKGPHDLFADGLGECKTAAQIDAYVESQQTWLSTLDGGDKDKADEAVALRKASVGA